MAILQYTDDDSNNINLFDIEKTAEFYDFDILVLNKSVQLNENVSMIKLPEENISCPRGETMMVSGWGRTWVKDRSEFDKSRFLMTTEVTCLDLHNHCKVFEVERFENSTICAGNQNHNDTGAWKGDSGGSYINLIVVIINV